MMTQTECLKVAQAQFGPEVRLEKRMWVLPTSRVGIEMCYAWLGDKIVAVGGDWDALLP